MTNIETYITELEELESNPQIRSEIKLMKDTRKRIEDGLLIDEEKFVEGSKQFLKIKSN